MTFSDLGAEIKRAREAQKISRYSLAKLADTTPNTVYDIESGRTKSPRIDLAARLLAALGLKLSDFEDVA